MSAVAALARAERASLVAPAGTGKTQVIAEAVGSFDDGRQLVLTHTHAGVDALRRRFKVLGIPAVRYHVDTIAGWCLRLASSFPTISGMPLINPRGPDWTRVYHGAERVLNLRIGQSIVEVSYAGCFVDEYQDCSVEQHTVVLAIAAIVPTRVLGDPLQGIFGFRNTSLVGWAGAVAPAFPPLSGLDIPWRWRNANSSLGEFVQRVRHQLIAGIDLDLRHPAVERVQITTSMVRDAHGICHRFGNAAGSVIVIREWSSGCPELSSVMSGRYSCIEALESKDLYDAAIAIDSARGVDLAVAIVAFASKCLTAVSTAMKPLLLAMNAGKRTRKTEGYQTHLDLLWAVADRGETSAVAEALRAMVAIDQAVLHRTELFDAMAQALDERQSAGSTLVEAVWRVRDRDRHRGRSLPRLAVATPLLVKGLEFDTAVVLDLESMDAAQAYVALTRASKRLAVVTSSAVLRPRRWPAEVAAAVGAGLL